MIKTTKNSSIIIKLIICSSTFILWIIYRIATSSIIEPDLNYEYCFNDRLLTNYLYPITIKLSQNLQIRDLILISGSNLLDLLMLYKVVMFVKIGDSWKIVTNLLLFYGVRSIVQNVFALDYYHTYLFLEAPFPSIFVPVFRATDFFYSGHCGITLIAALQFRDWGYKKFYFFGLFISIWEGIVMTILRTHYSIDIIFGWLISHYCLWWSNLLSDVLDKKFNFFGKRHDYKRNIEFKSLQIIRGEEIRDIEYKNKSSYDDNI